MGSKEELASCFHNLGCELTDDAIVKCLELCANYGMDMEVLVEMWVGFSVPRQLDFDPTVETLTQMENSELKGKQKKSLDLNESVPFVTGPDLDEFSSSTTDVLDMYSDGQTTSKAKRARSPTADMENDVKLRAVDTTFVPSTFTPTPSTPSRGPSLSARGKILFRFGPVSSLNVKNDVEINVGKSDVPHVPKDVVYMYEMLAKQAAVLHRHCKHFGKQICAAWDDVELTNTAYNKNVRARSQVVFRTWGRIRTTIDASSGVKVVQLEGVYIKRSIKRTPWITLDFSHLQRYSVFSGQIVAVEGINTTGNALIVKKLFSKMYPPTPLIPKLPVNLRIYVAAGPFTASDNLNYQPLWDLMEQVAKDEPDVLILIGPFLEYTHSEIRSCSIKDTFQELFEKILSRIAQTVNGKSTKVVLVPSNRDVHHEPVYPTPEFVVSPNKVDSKNLIMMPDPCVLNFDGLQIGVTSVDSVKHLGHAEVSNTSGMDRLGRLADHILSQGSFYPLYPASPSLNVDTTLCKKYAGFVEQPHILILPSDVRYYCKVLNQCLTINPERMHKYIYCKLFVPKCNGEKWDPNGISCEVTKV